MNDRVAKSVDALFEPASKNPKLAEDFDASSFRVQFRPLQGEEFNIRIDRGGYAFADGVAIEETDVQALYLVEVKPCLEAIFTGEATLGNALFDHSLRIPGYRNKEPLIGEFSRFVRRAVWATIPGASILRPVK